MPGPHSVRAVDVQMVPGRLGASSPIHGFFTSESRARRCPLLGDPILSLTFGVIRQLAHTLQDHGNPVTSLGLPRARTRLLLDLALG